MDTFVIRQAVVASFMQAVLYAEEVAGTTLRSTELDAGS
jgi:hypothetical protein